MYIAIKEEQNQRGEKEIVASSKYIYILCMQSRWLFFVLLIPEYGFDLHGQICKIGLWKIDWINSVYIHIACYTMYDIWISDAGFLYIEMYSITYSLMDVKD